MAEGAAGAAARVTILARLVARVRDSATQGPWGTVAGLVPAAERLVSLLEVPDGGRFSPLELWRRGPTSTSGAAMAAAPHRVAEIGDLGLAGFELGVVPHRRVVERTAEVHRTE